MAKQDEAEKVGAMRAAVAQTRASMGHLEAPWVAVRSTGGRVYAARLGRYWRDRRPSGIAQWRPVPASWSVIGELETRPLAHPDCATREARARYA